MLPIFIPVLNGIQIRIQRKKRKEASEGSLFIQEIAQLLEVAINKGSFSAAYTFLFIVSICWILAFLLLIQVYPFIFALVGSLVVPVVAIIFLNFRIYMNRVKISYEGLAFITEFTNNYRIYQRDVVTAMEQTIRSLDDKQPNSKKMLQHLLYRVRNASVEKDYDIALEQMIFTYDTTWSKQLATVFKIGLLKGDDITPALLDIQQDLTELEGLNEKKKQLNIQTGFMLKFLIPAMIIGGLYFIFGYLEFTIEQFIEYQFINAVGVKFFIPTILLILSSIVMYFYFLKRKNDFL